MRNGLSALHTARFMMGIEQPSSQTTVGERALLVSHLPGKRRIVEIGVFEGSTTRLLTDHADVDATIYGIDPFFKGRLGLCWGELIAKRHNSAALRSGRLHLIQKLSTEVGDEIPTLVDFIFIDGDHSLEGITRDWAFWSERLAPQGVIALHDSLVPAHNPNVARLGSHQYYMSHIRLDQGFDLVGCADSLAVLRRRSWSTIF